MDFNAQYEAVRNERTKWEAFKQNEQFEKLKAGCEAQLMSRRLSTDSLRPTSLDALIDVGSTLSEMSGIRLVLSWPDIMIEQLLQQERILLERINE